MDADDGGRDRPAGGGVHGGGSVEPGSGAVGTREDRSDQRCRAAAGVDGGAVRSEAGARTGLRPAAQRAVRALRETIWK